MSEVAVLSQCGESGDRRAGYWATRHPPGQPLRPAAVACRGNGLANRKRDDAGPTDEQRRGERHGSALDDPDV
jgi:hypothetical protein